MRLRDWFRDRQALIYERRVESEGWQKEAKRNEKLREHLLQLIEENKTLREQIARQPESGQTWGPSHPAYDEMGQ